MDSQPDLTLAAAPGEGGGVFAEQAVFTSIRTALGEGYRIIVASSGLTVTEKREITQRSPSHDSLCHASPRASGLASYPLGSGRHCVAVSRHAGLEQSGRGGQRVYTHLIVLARGSFRRFGCNPLAVQDALRRAGGDQLILEPPPRLERLMLPAPASTGPTFASTEQALYLRGNVERIAGLVSAVLNERRVVVSGAPDPQHALFWTLQALPCRVREFLATSFGLKLNAARICSLTFVESCRSEAERSLRQRDLLLYDWQSPPSAAASAFDAWLRFVRTWWDQGRYGEIERLCSRLAEEASAPYLAHTAKLATDVDLVKQADAEVLEALAAKHAHTTARGEADADLLRQFHQAVEARRAHLRELQQCATAAHVDGAAANA
jgi:hypothetical protein